MTTRTLLSIAALTFAATSASADPTRIFHWEAGDSGGVNNAAGAFDTIHSTFDADTNRFTWQVTFSNQITDGFTLAVSPGPNPKGHAGELALLYFDARDHGDVRMTVYNYNGLNNASSYYDGSNAPGTQSPDLVLGTTAAEGASYVLSAADVGGDRIFTIDMDATLINTHTPAYPGSTPWTGVAYGTNDSDPRIGVWMHPFKNLNASYNPDGSLASWGGSQGWFDGRNFLTVPTPASATMLGLAGLAVARRRR